MDLERFEDYKREVISAYKKKKEDGTLPPNLRNSTAANLKNECLAVFHKRYSEKDNETFKALYGERENGAEYLKKINTSVSSDKFKPLDNFLKKDTKSGTHNRNIELLAWLINFEPRPHRPGDIYKIVEYEASISENEPEEEEEDISPTIDPEVQLSIGNEASNEPGEDQVINVNTEEETSGQSPDKPKPVKFIFGIPIKFKRTVIAFCATVAVLATIYVAYILKPHECMYWDGDQYQAIACDQKVEGASTIALDPVRLDEVKRITNISAITRKDIGKIFYSKESGKVEFYTGSGENPADTRKRLLPMTEHIFEKYVLGLAVSP